jgi:hypothetical protein
VTTPHPAARVLLFYAACLAAMLVAAVTIASLRDTPSAKADDRMAPAELRVAKTR